MEKIKIIKDCVFAPSCREMLSFEKDQVADVSSHIASRLLELGYASIEVKKDLFKDEKKAVEKNIVDNKAIEKVESNKAIEKVGNNKNKKKK